MSVGQRAYNLLRAYVGQTWDRLSELEAENQAREEIRASKPASEPARYEPVPMTPEEEIALARNILGVTPESSFDEIRRSFQRLNKRSEPSNFPEGSLEADQARAIQKRVNWAFQKLTEQVDEREKRFRTLEI